MNDRDVLLPFCGFWDFDIVLRSIVFLLVIISVITTPTRAYEANAHLIVLKQQSILTKQEFFTNVHFFKERHIASLYGKLQTLRHSFDVSASVCAFNNQTQFTTQALTKNRVMRDISDDVCALAALKAEKDYQIKDGLLQTIASVESGRWNRKFSRRISWPWAVQVNGKGYYYQSKEEAVQTVKALLAEGITNIDVGCMQINLKYHGNAFNTIEDAFDPAQNVAYSARFLRNLYQRNGRNWQITAMQYHSKNHARGVVYKSKLEQHFAVYIAENDYQTLF